MGMEFEEEDRNCCRNWGSTWRWHCAGAGGAASVAMAVTVATNAHAGRGDKRPGRGFREPYVYQ
uniref:Uncharacterized protein n=1 Tax=Hyaloperonospora arabidopsidis (strain Emoy2) TaxID=559515 RepID=M4BRD9_HYAAE